MGSETGWVPTYTEMDEVETARVRDETSQPHCGRPVAREKHRQVTIDPELLLM
jgi:hypothetical protein